MSRKISFLLIKILFGLACFGFIFLKLQTQFTTENTAQLKSTFLDRHNLLLFFFTTLLLFLNWGIESYKWQLITARIQRISFATACKSVLTGLCIGNLTPGRLGEFAGRILFFAPDNRSKISLTHFVCGLTQLFVTVFAGIMALLFVISNSSENTGSLVVIFVSCAMLLALLILAVLNINRLYAHIARWKIMQRFNLGEVTYDRAVILRLLFYSLLRYLVFSFQYFLLLRIFGVSADGFHVACAIAVSFMLMSSIPMISFIEVAVRAAIAVMLFGRFQENSLQLISASTFLWIINIVIPSVFGYAIAVKEKFEFPSFKRAKNA